MPYLDTFHLNISNHFLPICSIIWNTSVTSVQAELPTSSKRGSLFDVAMQGLFSNSFLCLSLFLNFYTSCHSSWDHEM